MLSDKKKLIALNIIFSVALLLFTAFSVEPVIGGLIGFIAMIVLIFINFFIHFFSWIIPFYFIGLLIANVKAYKTVRHNVISNEILLFFGSIGAFIASCIYDITKENKQRIRIIFSVSLWIMIIYPVCCFILYKLDLFNFPVV